VANCSTHARREVHIIDVFSRYKPVAYLRGRGIGRCPPPFAGFSAALHERKYRKCKLVSFYVAIKNDRT